MVFNQGDDIRNRIITEFVSEGEKKAADAVENLRKRTAAVRADTLQTVRAAERANDVYRLWGKALGDIDRENKIAKLANDLAAATRSGKELDKTLEQVKSELQQIGATEGEVRRVIGAAQSASGGARRRSFLTAAGQELRALPALDTGLGFSTDVIGKLAASIGTLPPVAIAGTAAAASLVAVVAELSRRYNEQKEAVIKNIEAQARLAFLAETSDRKTIDNLKKDADARRAEALNQVEIADGIIANFLDGFENAAHRQINAEAIQKAIEGNFKAIVPPDVQGAIDVIKAQGQIAEQATIEIIGYNRVLADTGFIARENTAAQEEANRIQQDITDKRVQATLAAELAVANMSGEAIQQRLEAINREQAAILAVARAGEIGDEALARLTERQRELAAEADVLANALEGALASDRRAAMIETVRNADAQIADLTERRAEKEADLYRRMNDSIIKATEQAVEAADRAIQKLQERRDDLARDVGRGERDAGRKAELDDIEAQIKFRQGEQKQLRDHLRTLRQIREDAQAQEFGLVRDRDFTGLRDLRAETNRRLRDEARSHQEQRAERQLAFGEQIEDEQRRRAFERESRLLRYQDQLEDAQIQHERELRQIQSNKQKQLAAAAKAYTNELNLLNQKHGQELSMLANAVQQELNLVAAGNQERLRLEEQFILARAALWRQSGLLGLISGGIGSNTTTTNNTLNAPINVQTGAGGAQLTGLVGIIRGEIAKAFSQYAGAN